MRSSWKWKILVGHCQTWQTEWKTAPLTKVQLCEYENQTLEAFVAASRLYTSGPPEFFIFSFCAWSWNVLIDDLSISYPEPSRLLRWSWLVRYLRTFRTSPFQSPSFSSSMCSKKLEGSGYEIDDLWVAFRLGFKRGLVQSLSCEN